MIKFFRRSLLIQLVSAFSALSLITLVVAAYTAYIRARESLQESVYERLTVAVSLKEYDLVRWFETQKQDTLLLAETPDVQQQATILASARRGTANFEQAYKQLSQYFAEVTELKPNLQDLSLLTSGGIVLLSTDKTQEGTYQGLGNLSTYFERGQNDVVPNFYTSPLTGQSQITLATPVAAQTGRGAVLAINLNLQTVDELVRERSGLGETGQTYLVGRSSAGQFIFLSGGAEAEQEDNFVDGVNSFGIDEAMQGEDGRGSYLNYVDIPVLGVFRWNASQNLALIAELDQSEAFQPATDLARDIGIIGIGSAALLVMTVYLLARQLTRPILTITDSAAAIESNQFELNKLDQVKGRSDELGQLARVFQRMAQEVYEREQRLKQQVADLRIEIDQAKRARQVEEVTDTDYFRDLQQRSKELRGRFRRDRRSQVS